MADPDGPSGGVDLGTGFPGTEPSEPDGSDGGLQDDPDDILGDPTDPTGGDSTDRDTSGSAGGGGGGGGSTTSPTRTVTRSTTLDGALAQPASTVTDAAANFDPVDAAAPFTGAAVVADTARDVQRSDPAADFRQFQRETTPVEDAGRQTRQFLGLPSEAELSQQANEALAGGRPTGSLDVPGPAGAGGTGRTPTTARTPRELRLDARSAALRGIDEGVDRAVDAVPGDERGVAAGATALAVAEPTPFGEAALLGGSALAGVGGSALSNPEQGSELVPSSGFGGAEIDAPSDPAGDQPGEVDAPARPQGSRAEIDAPSDADVGLDSELDVGDGTGSDAGIQAGGQGVVLDEGGDSEAPTISREDLIDDRGAPEQDPPSTRERQRREDLDVFERDFPGRENQVIGRDTGEDLVSNDVLGQGTDVTSGAPTDVGVGGGSPTPVTALDSDLDQSGGADSLGGVDLDTGFNAGSDTGSGTNTGSGTGSGTGADTDTDTRQDTDAGSGSGTASGTALVEASASLTGADATAPSLDEFNRLQQQREPAQATPPIATPTSGRPRRPRRPRTPEFDREPQEPDLETLVTEGETVTNPTRSLSAVDEDLQEVFDGPP